MPDFTAGITFAKADSGVISLAAKNIDTSMFAPRGSQAFCASAKQLESLTHSARHCVGAEVDSQAEFAWAVATTKPYVEQRPFIW